ncbi:BlaR1 peptidase M56 [Mucilaginibacter yixingensis]|uniref:BlaR1 peptidase M56 n=1 Tax=Mucilaginibacter yixingensis TaxID=1295612 RepID=A0A2T5JA07_9SPHI|nr:M56 family metallopeptidase [Mucilaginibacter yixingensis]PTQ96911.1 BlaR1 peptidase M56 [Mucilaginibacter yixingensis]
MPELFIYLIKVNVALLVFCAGYYLVLRRLTFYTLNRIYLVTAILFATLYSRVDLNNFLQRHEQINKPIQVVIINWQAPVKALTTRHDQWYWLQMAFWAGVIILGMRLGTQLLSLYRLHKRSEPLRIQQYFVRAIKGNVNPFSFWRSIYVNPENHEPNDLQAILEHEQIHVNEWHTLDILLGELSAVFYWFNPGIWLMKRAIRENIEFITDRKILQKGMDTKTYQYSLLNVNLQAQNHAIANNFNISTIKKRIMMMNARRSSNINITRYLILVPAVMLMLLVFSVSKAEISRSLDKAGKVVAKALNKAVVNLKEVLPEHAKIKADEPVAKPAKTIKAPPISINEAEQPEQLLTATYTTAVGDTILKKQNIEYYINGKKVENLELNKIPAADIDHIEVYKDPKVSQAKGMVYITLKNANGTVDTSKKANTFSIGTGKKSLDPVTVLGYRAAKKVKTDSAKVEELYQLRQSYNLTADTIHVTSVKINGKKTGINTKANVIYLDSVSPKHTVTKLNNVQYADLPIFNQLNFDNKLIIINGKEATQKQFRKLSAADIKTVSKLSTAGAKAIYGDKGANGAIIITTK